MTAGHLIPLINVLAVVFIAGLNDAANVPPAAVMSDSECSTEGTDVTEACAFSAMQLRASGRATATTSTMEQYNAYLASHGRQDSIRSPESADRFSLWLQRKGEVESHNSQPQRRWTAAVNSLSDRTEAELSELRGWRGKSSSAAGASGSQGRVFFNQMGAARPLPEEYTNWTNLLTTQTIMNQGACGSCWAVTSATVLNAHSEIYQAGDRYSAQELVDCVPDPHKCGGDGGCKGATVELAMNYAVFNGLAKEQAVPYRGRDGICKNDVSAPATGLLSGNFDSDSGDSGESLHSLVSPGVHVSPKNSAGTRMGLIGWERLPENAYLPLLRALFERGPVGVSVAASGWSLYGHGVFDGCSKDAVVDHAVTLIGYGIDRKTDEKYWLIQNSWGPHWGESGHIRLLRTDNDDVDQCGVDHKPEAGTGCEGGPKQVKICGMCGILYDNVVPHFEMIKDSVSP